MCVRMLSGTGIGSSTRQSNRNFDNASASAQVRYALGRTTSLFSQYYFNWYDSRFQVRAIFPFDTLAVAYVTSPDVIACDVLPAQIQTLPDDIRPEEVKPYLIVDRELAAGTPLKYCHTADDTFVPDLVRRLLGQK